MQYTHGRSKEDFMKMSIKWHEECLYNQKKSLEGYLRNLKHMQERVESLTKSTDFYESQIKEAREQGKDGFDSERFMVKRK